MKLSDLRESVFEGFRGGCARCRVQGLVRCHGYGGHGGRNTDLWDCAGRGPCSQMWL